MTWFANRKKQSARGVARVTVAITLLAALMPRGSAVAQQGDPQQELPVLPTRPESGRTYPVRLEDANRGVRLTINNAALLDQYGPYKAPDGQRLLVLNSEWENIIPLTYVVERKEALATLYKIPNLADHIYVVIDGRRVARLDEKAGELPGHVPVKDFTLEKLGDRLRGNLIFRVPAGETLGWAEVRFYDFAHGHMVIPLGDRSQEAQAKGQDKPISPTLKNEVVEAGVFGLKKTKELNGKAAPSGMTYVLVDLRARSMFTIDGDATAFDSKARPGQRLPIGTVADWTDSRKYCQLVVDGEYAYMPVEGATLLDPQPRFLPDVMTGGQVAFCVPEQAQSLELRCDFPNARLPNGQQIRPKGLTIPLEGKRPQLPAKAAVAALVDDVYRVNIVGQRAVDSFAGAKPESGNVFLVLDVTVQNAGSNGEFFQTTQQLKYVSADAQQHALDPATFQGLHRPAELIWIPPGERRSFEAVFQAPAGDKQPRLSYQGVSMAKVVDLKPMEQAIAAGQAATKPAEPAMTVADATPERATKPAPAVAMNTAPAPQAPKPPPPKPMEKPKPKEPPTRVPIHPPGLEPKGLAGVGLTAEQVNNAIDRGAAGLWNFIKANDLNRNKFGAETEHLISALALVHSGFHKKSPEFDAALRSYLDTLQPHDNLGTYNLGVLCMLIEAYGDPLYYPQLREAAKCLVEGQGPKGTWNYSKRLPDEMFVQPVDPNPLRVDGGEPLDGTGLASKPLVRETKMLEADDGDNSVSQYAVLGLNSAARSDVIVPVQVWQAMLKETRRRQSKDGGWGYHEGSSYGSMTAAGISAVAITRHWIGGSDEADTESIERGLAWLSNRFTVNSHPEHQKSWLYYYLYSVERVGRVLDTEFIGDHEWYPLGARYLVDQQKADGTWENQGDSPQPRLPTSFALLFLTRATSTLAPAEKPRGGNGMLKTAVNAPPSIRIHIILDASGSMLEEMDGRMKFDIARDAVAALIKELPDDAEVGLRVYGHRKRAIEQGASEDTQLLIPRQQLERNAFLQTLSSLRARGKTPLALSLKQAAGEVTGGTDKDPINVILLTDGGEDTMPRQDPLKAADEFAKVKGVRLHVVGFDIGREDWSEQLQAIARHAGGQYYPAARGDALLSELRNAVFGTPESYLVLSPDGKREVAHGKFGDTRSMQEGKYLLQTTFGGYEFQQPFWINTDRTTAVTFDAAKVAAAIADGKVARPVSPAGQQQAAQPQAAPEAQPAPAPAGEKRFCTNCGAPLPAGAKFCTKCGAKVGG